MRQMICLLSEQLVPSYIAVKHYRPERVWRILTERTKKDGRDRMFCNAIRQYVSDAIDLPDCGQHLADPSNYVSTYELVQHLIVRSPADDWVVNVSGGNKMMSAGAIMAAASCNKSTMYTEIGCPDRMVDARTGVGERFSGPIKVTEFLILYGFTGETHERAASGAWSDLARSFAANPPEENVLKVTDEIDKRAQKKGLSEYAQYLSGSLNTALRDELAYAVGGSDLTKWQYGFVAGKWLEVFLYDLIAGYRGQLGVGDVQLGMRVHHGGVSNEFDIALTRGVDLIYIECKSGRQRMRKPSDQIEEVLGTLAQLKALRAKALIATTGVNFVDPKTGRLPPAVASRLREAGMRVLTRSHIVELARCASEADFVVPLLDNFLGGTAGLDAAATQKEEAV